MKTWNKPEVAELNINETANGIWNSEVETLLFFNDSKAATTPDVPDTEVRS